MFIISHDIRPIIRRFIPEKFKRILSRIGHSCNVEIFLRDLCKKNIPITACVDIGAADGDFTELFIKCFKNKKIFMFEPRKFKSDELYKKFQKNVKIYNELISDVNEIKNFAVKGNASSYYDINELDDVIQLKSSRLDNFLHADDFKYSLVKIDVQGAELDVLNSIGNENFQFISAFIIEASTIELWKNQSDLFDIMDFMNKHNFYLYSIGHMHRDKNNCVIQIDLCFINKIFKEL